MRRAAKILSTFHIFHIYDYFCTVVAFIDSIFIYLYFGHFYTKVPDVPIWEQFFILRTVHTMYMGIENS